VRGRSITPCRPNHDEADEPPPAEGVTTATMTRRLIIASCTSECSFGSDAWGRRAELVSLIEKARDLSSTRG